MQIIVESELHGVCLILAMLSSLDLSTGPQVLSPNTVLHRIWTSQIFQMMARSMTIVERTLRHLEITSLSTHHLLLLNRYLCHLYFRLYHILKLSNKLKKKTIM